MSTEARPTPVDVLVGLGSLAVDSTRRTARPVARAVRPVVRPFVEPLVRAALEPPFVPARLRPRTLLEAVGRRGARDRVEVSRQASEVLDQVLPRVVGELLRHADLTDNVPRYVDLAELAEQVIDEVDLPEIIRESTGSMASDTVRGARMHSIAADEAVHRAVRRMLLRRGNGTAPTPGPATQHTPGP